MLLLSMVACDGKSGGIGDIEAEVSSVIGTVVTVRFTTDDPVTASVAYGPTAELGLTTATESEPTTDHAIVLLGLTEESDVSIEVHAGDDVSEVITVTTGALSNEAPGLEVVGDGHDAWTVVPILGSSHGPAILNAAGEFVWYYPDHRDLDVYRARLSNDGKSVLYNAASVSGDPATDSELVRVSLDGLTETTYPIPLLAHDFIEMSDGTIGAMVVEYRDVDGEPVRGDQIIEIAPDGTQSVAWSAWDCFDPAVDQGSDSEIGWTFANALDFHEDEDAYYMSLRNFSTLVKIDRATRTCPWAFGTTAATVTPAEGSDSFLHEHQFEITDDSILVFDNDGSTATESRILEYSYDGGDTAEEIWSYTSDPTIFTFVLGDIKRLDGGDTVVDWAVGGTIERVTPEQEVVWRVTSELGYAFGFMDVKQSLYQP